MGMFDSVQCNYPLPIPLDVVDIYPDIYDQEFQTKDLENLLDHYILNEDGELLWIKKEYEWKDDDSHFLKETPKFELLYSEDMIKSWQYQNVDPARRE